MVITLSEKKAVREGLDDYFYSSFSVVDNTPVGRENYTLDYSRKCLFEIKNLEGVCNTLDSFVRDSLGLYSMNDEKVDDGRRYYDSKTDKYFVWDADDNKFLKVPKSVEHMKEQARKLLGWKLN